MAEPKTPKRMGLIRLPIEAPVLLGMLEGDIRSGHDPPNTTPARLCRKKAPHAGGFWGTAWACKQTERQQPRAEFGESMVTKEEEVVEEGGA